jgi:putative aldouronate transport system permease protein
MIEDNRNRLMGPSFIHLFFITFSLLCLIPVILVLSVSFSKEADVYTYGYMLIPRQIDFLGYMYIFANPDQILNSYAVTIAVTAIGTFVSVLVMSFIAYSLSRKSFRYRKIVTFYVFFTMLFSGGLVPSYILITKYLKLSDTLLVLILPGLVNAFHIILLRTFFQQIPDSIVESAKIDGASEFRVLFSLILPLSKSVLATVAFLGALARWNDWFTALLYINKDELLPLQFLLYRIMANVQFLTSEMQNAPAGFAETVKIPGETARMAMCVLAAGPMLFVFPFFQKHFVRGLTVGSVKG